MQLKEISDKIYTYIYIFHYKIRLSSFVELINVEVNCRIVGN